MKKNNLLVKILGFSATLIQGDALVLDRWKWLKKNIPLGDNTEKILDVGCGTGAFTIGMALRGFNCTGLTWDEEHTKIAKERALLSNATKANFIIQDARQLDKRKEFLNSFDKVICTENIEHIINDEKLMIDISNCLRKDGILYLTTPNIDFVAITPDDNGPFQTIEEGWHVRRGYSKEDLERLCKAANLEVIEINFVSGFFSQKITKIYRYANKLHKYLGMMVILPLRILPLLFDKYIPYTGYSISLIAKK